MMKDPAKNPYVSNTASDEDTVPSGQGLDTIDSAATTGTLISLALIGGLITISGIMAFLVLSDEDADQALFRIDLDSILFLGLGFFIFVASAVAGLFLRRVMMKRSRDDLRSAGEAIPQPLEGNSPLPTSARRFLALTATSRLISQATLEGPAVLNAVLMLIDKNFAHLIPIALAIIGIAVQIPTAGKIKASIEETLSS